MEMNMSLAQMRDQPTESSTFIARMDFSDKHKVPYSTLAKAIREGKIELHFINNKILINEEEALAVTSKIVRQRRSPKADLFA
jgi:hypothetical protein